MTQRGPIPSLQELLEKIFLWAGAAEAGPLEATPPRLLGAESELEEIEMLFPEEGGMWAGVARTTGGHHRPQQQQVVGTELTCCQRDHLCPGDPTELGLTPSFWKEDPGHKAM